MKSGSRNAADAVVGHQRILCGLALLVLSTAVLSSCSGGLFGPPKLSESEAKKVTTQVMTAVSTAVSSAFSQSLAGAYSSGTRSFESSNMARSLQTYQMNYSGSGMKVTGTINFNDSSFSYSYRATITFSSLRTSDVKISSGKAYYDFSGSASSFTGKYTGSFDIEYKGNDHKYSWSISCTSSAASGTYTIDGNDYHFSGTSPGSGVSGGGTGTGTSGTGSSSSGASGTESSDSGTTTGSDSTADSPPQICFWSSVGNQGSISVYLDNSYKGSLTHYFPSDPPTFGQSGTLTVTTTVGTHSVRAKSQAGGTWGPKSVTLTAGERLRYKLQ